MRGKGCDIAALSLQGIYNLYRFARGMGEKLRNRFSNRIRHYAFRDEAGLWNLEN